MTASVKAAWSALSCVTGVVGASRSISRPRRGWAGPSRNGSAKMSGADSRSPTPRPPPAVNGPSNVATICEAASGSSPYDAGIRAVRASIEAARAAATPFSGPSPSTIGIESARVMARILAGLTKDSERGRQASACRSSRSAMSYEHLLARLDAGPARWPRASPG